MPLYKLRCKACNKVFEQTSSVNDRLNIRCECGGNSEIMIQPVAFHIFEPFDHPNLDKKPVHIKSRKHLQQEANKRGMRASY